MYGDLLNAMGLAFILFIVIMFVGFMFKGSYSGILKAFITRLLIVLFIVTVCIVILIIIIAFINDQNPLELFLQSIDVIKNELTKLWS